MIGHSIGTLSNAFIVAVTKGAENGAKKLAVGRIPASANRDSVKQLADVEDPITMGVVAIIINPCNAEAIAPGSNRSSAPEFPSSPSIAA